MLIFRLLTASAGVCLWTLTQSAQGGIEGQIMTRLLMYCLVEEANITSAVLPSMSDINCAYKCHRMQCMAFIFSGGDCEIRGAGMANETHLDGFNKLPVLGQELRDISRGKETEARDNLGIWYSWRAIDGNMKTYYHSASESPQPWWVLDMGSHNIVFEVEVLPREGFAGRFHDIQIRVGSKPRVGEDFSAWPLLGEYLGPYRRSYGRLSFTNDSGICGRYVAIHKTSLDIDHLQLTDVKIYVPIF